MKKKAKRKKKLNAKKNDIQYKSCSALVSSSIAIQSDLKTQKKQQNMIDDFFNPSIDHKEQDLDEFAMNTTKQETKKCCYHCYTLFILDMVCFVFILRCSYFRVCFICFSCYSLITYIFSIQYIKKGNIFVLAIVC